MRAIIWISLFHLFAFVFYSAITEITISVSLAITLSYLFCVIPMLFGNNSLNRYVEAQSKLNINGTNLLVFTIFLAIPIVFLVYERMAYGFEISINPVAMRDQMIQRHNEGGGGGILAIIGNLSHIIAMFFFFKYLLLEKSKRSKSFIATIYILASAWIAGSRALILIILLLIWTKNSLKIPAFRNIIILSLFFLAGTYIFVLRADRSGIDVAVYLFQIIDHLRLSYDGFGAQLIRSPFGPLILSFAYIIHSMQSLSDIIASGQSDGISLAPLVHFLNLFGDLDNSDYAYQGLFLSSFGLFYHDFGIIGVIVILIIKCWLMFYASRSKDSFFSISIVLILTADSVMGIWTSIINIVFMAYVIIALALIAISKNIRFKIRKM